jgi:hypothetical protein
MKLSIFSLLAMLILTLFFAAPAVAETDDFGIPIATSLIFLLVSFVFFLVLRELFCWYWKVNEIVSLLRDIRSAQIRDGASLTRAKHDAPHGINTVGETKENPFSALDNEREIDR